jgi:hypothetical protein
MRVKNRKALIPRAIITLLLFGANTAASLAQAPAPASVPIPDTAAGAKVTLAEFAWLEGKWQGSWGPRTAEQVWMAPKAGEMLGLSRVVENEKTLVIELYSLVETPNGIELRFRHFTPSLAAWEDSSYATLKIVSFDPKTIVFENPTGGKPKRNAFIRIDAETYISRSEIVSDSENKQVTDIRYHRTETPPGGQSRGPRNRP